MTLCAVGGKCDSSKGYFIEPTVIVTTDPHYATMQEELFGPVLTVYVYPADKVNAVLACIQLCCLARPLCVCTHAAVNSPWFRASCCCFDAEQYEDTLRLCDATSPYALTGSLFSDDRYALEQGMRMLM